MENPTPFYLKQAIVEWRCAIAACPAFRAVDIQELEGHLQDSIAALQSKGLSDQEAFWLATRRIGTAPALNEEFGKLNTQQIWLDRALWMVAGSLAISWLTGLGSTFVTLATISVNSLSEKPLRLGPFSGILQVVVFITLFVWAWRSTRKTDGWVQKFGRWMQSHPTAGAISAFLLITCSSAASVGSNLLAVKTTSISLSGEIMRWRMVASTLSIFLWPMLLGWLLKRCQS